MNKDRIVEDNNKNSAIVFHTYKLYLKGFRLCASYNMRIVFERTSSLWIYIFQTKFHWEENINKNCVYSIQ